VIGWLLDTHVVGALASPTGAPTVRAWAAAQEEERLFLSVLTLAEIEKGIEQLPPGDPARSRHAGTLAAIEARFAGRILPIGDDAVRDWGRISGRVKRETGAAPPVIDTLIAATAIAHDLYFATRNTRDVALSGAALFNPWADDPARFPLT
jgi:predicted nucleic acid-binding protein